MTWDGASGQELAAAVRSSTKRRRPFATSPFAARADSGRRSRPTSRLTIGWRQACGEPQTSRSVRLRDLKVRDHARGDRRNQMGGLLGCAAQCSRWRRRPRRSDAANSRRCQSARSAAQARRGSARERKLQTTSCSVKTNGGRLEVTFPGVQLGVFAGRLEYTVYKGTNLIKQSVIAKTEEKSVAYKYEAGLKGVKIQPSSRVVWRSVANEWVGLQARRRQKRQRGPAQGRQSPGGRRRAGRVDRGIPAAPPFLHCARDRIQPRIQLLS